MRVRLRDGVRLVSEFNLRALVREVAATSTMNDPGDIAEEVAKRIARKDTAEALRQALRVFVRQVISEQRPHSIGAPSSPVTSPKFRSAGPAANRSAKVAAIRDGWQKHLRARYHVGDGQWSQLGDCGREQLDYIATFLDNQAAQKQAKARSIRRLAEAVTEHEVKRVRDLPAELLMTAFGEAA